ncbi:MAG: EamA family transporter [Candidatus Fimenecus sp.]
MLESLKKNGKGIVIMLFASVFACVGQLFWKISANKGFLWAVIGFGFYGLGALFMLYAYKFGEVSVLQPVMSMNYVISLILGAAVLSEPLTKWKIIGVLVIIVGVIFIGGGSDDKKNKKREVNK